eukprot:Em0005g876a
MKFINNSGMIGAAIVVDVQKSSKPFSQLINNPQCFLTFDNRTSAPKNYKGAAVTIIGNTAAVGPAIYISHLDLCAWISNNNSIPVFDSTYFPKWAILDIRNNTSTAHQNATSSQFYIQTEAASIESLNSSGPVNKNGLLSLDPALAPILPNENAAQNYFGIFNINPKMYNFDALVPISLSAPYNILDKGNSCIGVFSQNDTENSKQCHPTRKGILCGQCINGTAVGILRRNCRMFLWDVAITLLIILASSKLKVTFPPALKGLFFYIQTVYYATEFFPASFWDARQYMLYISSGLSLYFPWDFCLYPGATPLQMSAVQFITPATVLVVAITLLAIKRSNIRSMWHGILTLIILLYPSLVHNCMSLLHCPTLPDNVTSQGSMVIPIYLLTFTMTAHAYIMPYKEWWQNMIEMIVSANFIIILVLRSTQSIVTYLTMFPGTSIPDSRGVQLAEPDKLTDFFGAFVYFPLGAALLMGVAWIVVTKCKIRNKPNDKNGDVDFGDTSTPYVWEIEKEFRNASS